MIRFVLLLLLLFHGLIHLIGFFKAFRLAEMEQLSQPISRPQGLLWLLAALLFVLAALSYALHARYWWIAAAPAVLLSQFLIFNHWQDARFGSPANALILVVLIPAIGASRFYSMVEREKEVFWKSLNPSAGSISDQQLADLPPVVQRWLLRSLGENRQIPRLVRLRQRGAMRTEAKGKWMPFVAHQLFRINDPGFIWDAKVQAGPGLHLYGRDKWVKGDGQMLIKLAALFQVVNAEGPEINQGTALRFLAEICWFPAAALSDYLSWQEISNSVAQATLSYQGISVNGRFYFTPEGDFRYFEALRYYDRPEGATLETWHVECRPEGYRHFEGLRVPALLEVTWKLKSGDFTWLNLEVTDLDFE